MILIAATMFGSAAYANDFDKAACEGLAQGDACVDHNGRAGICVPDDSDPVLTCEDVADDNGGGSDDTGFDDNGGNGGGTDDTGFDDNGGSGGGTDDTGFDDNGGNAPVSLGSGGGDADRAACATLAEGDSCVDHNGRDGSCVPDDSDPDTLTCEDDASSGGSSSSSSGCSHSGGTGLGLLWLAPLVGLLGRRRSR